MPKFDSNGLLSAIVQDASSGEVLMVAFMDDVALSADQVHLVDGGHITWSGTLPELMAAAGESDSQDHVSVAEQGYLHLMQGRAESELLEGDR